MRMRKVRWAVEYLDEAQRLIADPEVNRGRWKEYFQSDVLHLELGCGKGKYSLDMSEKYPDQAFIAVERNETACGIAAKKYDEQAKEDNLVLIHGDAAMANEWFAPGEIDVIHLNFSDPWPKKRNAKRRLSSAGFLEQYKNLLSDEGRIEMKTDNQDLFEYSVAQFSNNGFVIDEISVDYRRNEHPEDAITEYEQKFIDAKQPVYRVVVRKGNTYANDQQSRGISRSSER